MLFERFKEGTENINYNERCGRPNVVTSSHIAAVNAHLEKYRCTWTYLTYNRIHVDNGLYIHLFEQCRKTITFKGSILRRTERYKQRKYHVQIR